MKVSKKELITELEFKRSLDTAVWQPFVFALMIAGFFFWQVEQLRSTSRWVDHADQVISKANGLAILMIESQASIRGYMLTNRPEMIEPFRVAESTLTPAFKELAEMVSDNPVQVTRLNEMRIEFEAWRDYSRKILALREKDPNHFDPNGHSKGLPRMEAARARFNQFVAEETALRTQRVEKAQATGRSAILSGLIIAFLLGFGITALTRRKLIRLSEVYRGAIGELKTEQLRLQSVLERAPIRISVHRGPDHIFEYANPQTQKLLEDREWLGKPIKEVYPHTSSRESMILMDQVYATGKTVSAKEVHGVLERSHGKLDEIYSDLVFEPLRGLDGKVEGVIAFRVDVTDQVTSRRKVEEAVTVRDEFLSVASHELKTPLTSLKLQAQLRIRSLEKSGVSQFDHEKLHALFVSDDKQIDRIAHLVEDMLDIARINSGRLTMEKERVELCALINEVNTRFASVIASAGCTISVSCSQEITGNWDRFRIEQVYLNLVTNATRYGQGKPIQVTVEQIDGKARLSVRDHGIGIASENQDRIFERFERAVSKNEVSGLGLGLYIVREIVRAHNGTVSVKSELGKGADFVVELPT